MQKLILVICLLGFVIGAGLFVKQRQQIKNLRIEGEVLRKEIEAAQKPAAADPAPAPVPDAERQELVRLRGEVASLRRQLDAASRQKTNVTATPKPALLPPDQPPGDAAGTNWELRTMSAQLQTTLSAGQTLITGGWASEGGKKTFVFVTPELNIGEGEVPQVSIKSVFIEAAESVLKPYGLDRLQAQGDKSTLHQLLNSSDAAEMINALKEVPGVNVMSAPQMATADGRPAQVSIGQPAVHPGSGQSVTLGPFMNVVPRISADQQSISLDLQANVNVKGPPRQQP